MSYYDIVSGNGGYGYADPYEEVDEILASGPLQVGARRRARGYGGSVPAGARRGMPSGPPVRAQAPAYYPQQGAGMPPAGYYQPGAPPPQQMDPMAWAIQQRQVQQATMYRNVDPTNAYDQILPMQSSGVIAPAGSASITARPQTYAFQPHRIVIPQSLATDFTIQDIKVGNRSQFVQTGAISAETFAQNAVGTAIKFDTVQTSQDFVIQVTNAGGAPRNFFATIFGASLSY